MSLDLLKKLVRLATNNPNEHESNLAARKACDLLIQKDFKLLPAAEQTKTAASKITQNKKDRTIDFQISQIEMDHNPELKRAVEKIQQIMDMKPGATKKPEPQWSYQPSARQQAYYDETVDDIFEQFFRGYKRRSWTGPDSSFYQGSWLDEDTPGNNEKKKIKCTICREEKETRFRGPADI